MSTVDSQLLIVVGAIVNDIYASYINPKAKNTAKISFLSTLVIGVIIFIAAYNPPKLMVWLNLFASTGLKATFLLIKQG